MAHLVYHYLYVMFEYIVPFLKLS